MPTRLTGMDAAFLYLETRTNLMHVGGVMILDPTTAPGGTLTREQFTQYVESRLHLAPPFRRRLVWTPFNLDHPQWIEDPDFDLEFHVRRAALPAPGGMAELAELCGDVMSRPMDRGRPLWEAWMVEGLEGGRLALVTKTHHAAIDGVSGAELAAAIMQLSPDMDPPPPERPWVPEPEPGDVQLLAGAAMRLATTPLALLRTGWRALDSATALLRVARERRAEPPPAPFTAPTTILNGAIGPHRRCAFTELSLDAVKGVKHTLGGTVNDVVLAAVTRGLRRYLQEHGEPTDTPLVAMVPISVRADGQEGAIGNHVSAMLVQLPVDCEDPADCLGRVTAATADAKEQHGALGATTIQELAEVTPGAVQGLASRLYTRTRGADRHRPIWNTIVSNVPGPRFPLYCAGAKLEALYPLGPVHEMSGLNITLFSYQDTIFVGLNADRELVRDVAFVADCLRDAVEELAKAADERAGA